MSGRATIAIATGSATSRTLDQRILVLHKGQAAESGTIRVPLALRGSTTGCTGCSRRAGPRVVPTIEPAGIRGLDLDPI